MLKKYSLLSVLFILVTLLLPKNTLAQTNESLTINEFKKLFPDASIQEKKQIITIHLNDDVFNLYPNDFVFEKNKEIYPLFLTSEHPVLNYTSTEYKENIRNPNQIPVAFIENRYGLNSTIVKSKNKYTLKKKEDIYYKKSNYNYQNGFIKNYSVDTTQEIRYVGIDEAYDNLSEGTAVLPSYTTGFSVVKPKYGIGSSTTILKESKGNAKADGWIHGTIRSSYHHDFLEQRKIFAKELGLYDGTTLLVNQIGDAVVLLNQKDTFEIRVRTLQKEEIQEFHEYYKVYPILRELLKFYDIKKADIEKIVKTLNIPNDDIKIVNESYQVNRIDIQNIQIQIKKEDKNEKNNKK